MTVYNDIDPLVEKSAKTQRIRILDENFKEKRNSLSAYKSERPHTYPTRNPNAL